MTQHRPPGYYGYIGGEIPVAVLPRFGAAQQELAEVARKELGGVMIDSHEAWAVVRPGPDAGPQTTINLLEGHYRLAFQRSIPALEFAQHVGHRALHALNGHR